MTTGLIQTGDGSHTLHSERYGETYHSINGATTEARHAFLQASGVAQRLEQQQPTRVLEIGFGLGLNFLLTADLALQHRAALDYQAFEHDSAVLQAIPALPYAKLLNSPCLFDNLVNALGDAPRQTICRLSPGPDIHLTLHQENALAIELPAERFNAVYLDAFSPDANPECWTADFFAMLRSRLIKGGALTTYSAKGSVRRAMIQAGLDVKKMAGPPGKREMLHGTA